MVVNECKRRLKEREKGKVIPNKYNNNNKSDWRTDILKREKLRSKERERERERERGRNLLPQLGS